MLTENASDRENEKVFSGERTEFGHKTSEFKAWLINGDDWRKI